jgi:hypothetical protein
VFGGRDGTMTPGNSTPLSDGASVVLLASEEWTAQRDIPVQAYITAAQTAAVDHVHKREGLLMAPAYAMPNMLDRAGLALHDFDYYEIHEAFAAQVLCTLAAWEDPVFCRECLGRDEPLGAIDRERVNVRGGSLGAGHPFGATGGRIVAGLAKLLSEMEPRPPGNPPEAIAQRALEGLLRSIGKAPPGVLDWERPLSGKVALVTGASRGIGEAIGEVLARDGAHVVGVDVPALADELEGVAARLGGSSLTADITTEDAPARIASHPARAPRRRRRRRPQRRDYARQDAREDEREAVAVGERGGPAGCRDVEAPRRSWPSLRLRLRRSEPDPRPPADSETVRLPLGDRPRNVDEGAMRGGARPTPAGRVRGRGGVPQAHPPAGHGRVHARRRRGLERGPVRRARRRHGDTPSGWARAAGLGIGDPRPAGGHLIDRACRPLRTARSPE